MLDTGGVSLYHHAAWVKTAVLSAVPITELRGAIPLAVFGFGMRPWEAFFAALAGNLVIIPPLLWAFGRAADAAEGWGRWAEPLRWWFHRVERRGGLVQKYGAIGLGLFVAVPLPFTGAWSGCVAAALFRQPFRKSLPAVAAGVVAAGVAVTLLTWAVQQGLIESGGPFLKQVFRLFGVARGSTVV